MEHKSSKIDELAEVYAFAKANKILKLKVHGIELELHPASFDVASSFESMPLLTPEEEERKRKAIEREAEELTYWSSGV